MGSTVDVVVVGAGAAGLAAGRRLQQAGISFKVIEARQRVGGRAFTDQTSFEGLPFDHGCHWLHTASINPLRQEADRLGIAYHRQDSWGGRAMFVDGRRLGPDEIAHSQSDFDAVLERIHAAGQAGRDEAASVTAGFVPPYGPVIRHIFTLISSGEPEEVSTLDMARYRDTHEDWPVIDGLGRLIATIGASVPVSLATPARAIDWSGSGVRIETDRGAIEARAAVVTASTNVLSAGAIRFTPALPVAMAEALAAVPIGCAEKVAFLLDRPLGELGSGNFLAVLDTGSGVAQNFYVNQFGRPLVVAHLGGRDGAALTKAGPAAMIAHARERLVAALGADVERRIVKAIATGWLTDPFIRGGYSYALPGKADLRPRLAEAVGGRIFLAGEAVSPDFYSTAHGAHLTGIRAAEAAMAAIGRDA
ncbi:MAG: NAD(P)/FAD-dependent oxidoreductase [Hyphomicrobiaceae bacterium]